MQGQVRGATPDLGAEDLQGGEVRDPGVHLDLKEKVMAVAVRKIVEAPAGAAP